MRRWGNGGIIVVFILLIGAGVIVANLVFGRVAPGPDAGTEIRGGVGGQLTVLGGDPPTLDPAKSSDTESATYVVEIYGGLVTLNHDLQVVPDIAEKWDISPDGKTYTFHLRKGVKFHDGKEVTANDFKYSVERAADPKTESIVADAYLGDILGVKDKLRGKANQVQGVKVVDDYTLQIGIDEPKSYFLAKLTYPTAFVVDKANVESGRDWANRPNGTGPFKLKEWRKGERITLEKNAGYHLGPAKLDRVNFLLAGGSAMTMYENNEIDITGIGLNDIDRVLDPQSPLNKQLTIATSLDVWYVGFGNKTPPFDDVKVRQAFSYAVDKDRIIKNVLKDLIQKADGILPPGMPGYNPNLKGLGFNIEKAKQLLAESKYKGPSGLPPLILSIPGSTASPGPSGEAILEMWKSNLGVEVRVQMVEWATFLQDLKAHKFQMFQVGWIADYPDPQDFLDILFHCDSLENNPQYCNPSVDKLLEQARVEANFEKRMKLYQEAEQTIVNEAPWLPLWYGKSYILTKPHIKGYKPAPMVIPTYRYVYTEK